MTPAISGPARLVDTSQLESAFGFDAAMLAAAAVRIATWRLPESEPSGATLLDRDEGSIRRLWANRKRRRLAPTLGARNFFAQMIWSVLVPYALDVPGLSSVG